MPSHLGPFLYNAWDFPTGASADRSSCHLPPSTSSNSLLRARSSASPRDEVSTQHKKAGVRNSPELEDIVLPLARRFEYYDNKAGLGKAGKYRHTSCPSLRVLRQGVELVDQRPWGTNSACTTIRCLASGWFQGARHCGRTTQLVQEPPSYHDVANQTKCPTTMSPSEFTARCSLGLSVGFAPKLPSSATQSRTWALRRVD